MGPDLESLFELEKSNKIRSLRNLFNDRNRGFRISRPEADGISFLSVMGMKNVSIGHIKRNVPTVSPVSPVYVSIALWMPKPNY